MELVTIAYARNGFKDKFGLPRQVEEGSVLETRIEFVSPYAVPEAVRGLEGYSHLWLLWGFHRNNRQGWSPTVRPPRLGGNKRVGVFATRSPIRPNAIGLTSVRLLRIEKGLLGPVLVVSGADMVDGSPIYDIKPYVTYADSHPDAISGFVDEVSFPKVEVLGLDEWMKMSSSQVSRAEWIEILEHNPRPAYQQDPTRVYKLDYQNETIAFTVADGILRVQI